jgi:hypothetical protein
VQWVPPQGVRSKPVDVEMMRDDAFGHLWLLAQGKLGELVGRRVERSHVDVRRDEPVDQIFRAMKLGVGDAGAIDVDRAAARSEPGGDRLRARDVRKRAREGMLRGVLGRVIATARPVDIAADAHVGARRGRGRPSKEVVNRPGVVDLRVDDGDLDISDDQHSRIPELPSALRIEERAIEHHRGLAGELGQRDSGGLEGGEVWGFPVELLGHDGLRASCRLTQDVE